jgi:translation initiation factor 1
MSIVCPVCGLPKEVCICGDIAKEQQRILIRTEKKRYGRMMTLVEGIDSKSFDTKEIMKKMKQKMACGGTVKNGVIELQGDHKQKVKELLVEMGFNPPNIEVI